MRKRRVSTLIALTMCMALVLGPIESVAFAIGGTINTAAATAELKKQVDTTRKNLVTQAQRELAADNLAKQKLLAGVSAKAAVVPTQGGTPDYFDSPNWAFSPPLRKFVDSLPKLGQAGANNLGQYIPIAHPDTKTYPGSDYYEIELRQYTEKLHSDLPPTTLRGYVQTNNGTNPNTNQNTVAPDPGPHYLGPFIIARKDRPVRVKFTNKLPTGQAGDLFIPVDTTMMGAGMGPLGMNTSAGKPMNYTQNRATLHLHGGLTPWISDGTPHQWITPAGENTDYPKGVSVQNVPDMPNPGDGSQTFFYTNQQSARLMFYHDHSLGITRLNVYAGEAAGYMITDATEDKLVADGVIPSEQIPMVVQDKTFVDAATVLNTDPTWNWGTGAKDANGYRTPKTGDLWYPHVYSPAQNPADLSGMNAYGRWHYGPWFWPPTTDIQVGPQPNPYYDPINKPYENITIPGAPNPSAPGEAFMDTPLVNGTAFPSLTVDAKAVRFRILNASDDRFWNLQLYEADSTTMSTDGRTNTEVKMVPAAPTAGFPDTWPTDGRAGGVPDPATKGPSWIQIGTEGGFLPKPAVVDPQPITWNTNQSAFTFGNVQDHSLLLGPAERADVVVDFSQYAGKTLIVYNDAPAPFPAIDPRLDYYSNAPDLTSTGGTSGIKNGFGPNTRTVMQIKVNAAGAATAFDMNKLNAAFASTATTQGVFAKSQNPIIVPEARYNAAYNKTFPTDPFVRIFDFSKTFKNINGTTVTVDFKNKAIQDEMGEAYDKVYGRMSGKLGVEIPGTNAQNQNFVLYGYIDPATENVKMEMTPMAPVQGDGTQIWKITHNGVDTHPIHFHLFDVQLINRVGWDNEVFPPDDNELGWKDTVRVNPLSDTIVALRPIRPKAPFGVPDSIRVLDPTMPEHSPDGFTSIDPTTGQATAVPVTNEKTNFGWEYVWHCHILSHEEMDMMRPVSADGAAKLAVAPTLTATRDQTGVSLSWTDATPPSDPNTWGDPAAEVGYRVERATVNSSGNPSAWTVVARPLANATSYRDTLAPTGTYEYRVVAWNAAGDSPSNVAIFGKTAVRISGSDRYKTAIAAAQDAFPKWGAVKDIVIAPGVDPMTDALSAAGLSKAYGAPLLLCNTTSLPASVRDAITSAGTTQTVTLHLVGNSINTATRAALASIPGVNPVLDIVAGSDRYATSQAVANRMRLLKGSAIQAVLFVNGLDSTTFYDAALATPIAAAKGFPILLVQGNAVPANTLSTVTNVGATERYIIGPNTTITDSNRLALGVPIANRWTGVDRYAESVTVATNAAAKGWLGKTKLGFSSTISDSISGGASMGAKGGVLLYVQTTSLPTTVRNFIVANKAGVTETRIYGSSASISDATVSAINTALQ